MTHWHVATGLAGYGPDASDDNWDTIDESDAVSLADAIRDELQWIAEFERDSAEADADSEDYKSAWKTMKNAESLSTMAANFDNSRKQAPLYADNPALWHETVFRMARESFPVDYRDGNSRLYVWECSENHDDWEEDNSEIEMTPWAELGRPDLDDN